jgi:hypothetical protein
MFIGAMMWPFKKKKTKILSHLPSFLIELELDGNLSLTASWATPRTTDELSSTVKHITGLLGLIGQGSLLPLFQHAVAVYGKNHNDEQTSKAVLITLDKVIRNQQQQQEVDGPLVPPSEAFWRG